MKGDKEAMWTQTGGWHPSAHRPIVSVARLLVPTFLDARLRRKIDKCQNLCRSFPGYSAARSPPVFSVLAQEICACPSAAPLTLH